MSVHRVVMVGFTATRKLPEGMTEAQADRVVADVLGMLDPQVHWLVLGAALGMERRIGLAAKAAGFKVHVIVPGLPEKLLDKIDPAWSDYAGAHEQLPLGDPNPFRARNHAVVNKCELLIGLPAYEEGHAESQRSGTWMTIRIAQRAGVETLVWPLVQLLPSLRAQEAGLDVVL